MTAKCVFLVFAAVTAFGADDPWTKVRELKTGTEIRVYKKGSKTPVVGKLDQATEDAVVIMLKKEETGIDREEVDRIDARPEQKGSRVTHTSNSNPYSNPAKLPPLGPHNNDVRPDDSTSSGASIGSRPDYETVYTRPAGR